MKALFDKISQDCSKSITLTYSTSFSMGIKCLHKDFHEDIYSIYGLVRAADEIVDSFEGFQQRDLLARFKADTYQAIEEGISLNPILNSFQRVVNEYGIDPQLIESFFKSMEMDLDPKNYDLETYETYIDGSAEVVGLMCLYVFVEGDQITFHRLKSDARKLGAAFQKINFLRDIKADYEILGRCYFPGVDLRRFDEFSKTQIEQDIQNDFDDALRGILGLPEKAFLGVYLAYTYYYALFLKIKALPADKILTERVRVSDGKKYYLFLKTWLQSRFARPSLPEKRTAAVKIHDIQKAS